MTDPTTSPGLLALRPKQAAESLGISERTLWGLTAPRGSIPCVRLGKGGVVVYPVDLLREWLRENAETAAEHAAETD